MADTSTGMSLRGEASLRSSSDDTCVNWSRTSPYIKAWSRDYALLGLVVIGVHSPEFEFGKGAENIDRGIRDDGLTYPIAIDNDFAIWRPRNISSTIVGGWCGDGSGKGATTKSRARSV